MDALEFIAILTTFAIVLIWYLQNAEAGSDGARGWLALRDDPQAAKPEAKRPSYRMKNRLARRAHEMRDSEGTKAAALAAPAYRLAEEGERMRRKFRRQDEARYKAKDKAGPKPRQPRGPSAA